MEEQSIECNDRKTVQDSAYGSLESSSNGQSQKSYSALESKSRNSGSSHGSTEYSDPNFNGKRIKEIKHKDHKRKKSKDKIDACTIQSEEKKSNQEEQKELESSSDQLSRSTEAEASDQFRKTDSTFQREQNSKKIEEHPSLVYSQALNYIRKIKENSTEEGLTEGNAYLDGSSDRKDISTILQKSTAPKGFTVAISVEDGSILQASPSITEVLDFPKELLLGHSLIELVHPKDTISFSSKIIHGLNTVPNTDGTPGNNPEQIARVTIWKNPGSTFFCRLRVYHSLKNGFGITNKKRQYKPCKVVFRYHMCKPGDESNSHQPKWFIIAEITTIDSVYKNPEETVGTGNFLIRHSATCNFSEYDNEAIRFLGHLPQDLIGNSVFDCYHPEDLPKLKKAYDEIIKNEGQPYRSEPYRFQTFSGSWVTLMTEWLCFVNPWTKKIESIIGRHRILKGPKEINIFNDPSSKPPYSEEVLENAEKAKKEILELLQKSVSSYKDPSREPTVKRRRKMADLMSPLVEELGSKDNSICGNGEPTSENMSTNKSDLPSSSADPSSHIARKPEKDQVSVVMGNISPHQDVRWNEGLPSYESPASSYHQLNYTETLERFFRSHPKTVSSDESGDSRGTNSQVDSLGLSNSDSANNKSVSASGCSGASADNSYKICDTSKAHVPGKENVHKPSSPKKVAGPLTQALLSQHNEDMQRNFVAKRKGRRRIISKRKFVHKNKFYKSYETKNISIKRSHNEDNLPDLPKHICPDHNALESDASGNHKYSSSGDMDSSCKRRANRDFTRTNKTEASVKDSGTNSRCEYQSGMLSPPLDYFVSGNRYKHRRSSSQTCNHCRKSTGNFRTNSQGGRSVQYYTPTICQSIVHPLSNAPSVMLPNTVYRLTALSSHETSDQDAKKPSQLTEKTPFGNESQFSQSTSVRAEAESLGFPEKKGEPCERTDHYNSSDVQISMKSSYASEEGKFTDDSYLLTSGDSSGTNEISSIMPSSIHSNGGKPPRPVLADPYWLEGIDVTQDLCLKYQLPDKELSDVLQHDLDILKKMKQPTAVEEQLSMLCKELELNTDIHGLNLEEGSLSSEDYNEASKQEKPDYFSRISMIYEEDAPMPPPVEAFDDPSKL